MEDYNIIRIIIVLISGMCIYLGYRLFYTVTERQGSLKVKGLNANVELSDVGPGTFFSLFGAVILIVSIINQPYNESTKTTSEDGGKKTTKVSKRSPASDNDGTSYSVASELKDFCVDENMLEHFENGIHVLEVLEPFKQDSPFATVADSEVTELFLLLKSLEFPDSYLDEQDSIYTYIDYYNLVRAALYLSHIKYEC